jgi:hypothetical protein
MSFKSRLFPLITASLLLLLAACNLPAEDLAALADDVQGAAGEDSGLDLQNPDTTDPAFASVEFSDLTLKGPQCMPNGVTLTALLEPDPSGISGVTLRYRLVGEYPDQTTDWIDVDMSEQGAVDQKIGFTADLPDAGAEAMNVFNDGWGQLEYTLIAEDGAGNTSSWPSNEPVAALGVSPCPLAGVDILDGSLEPQFAEYGQGLGCDPSIAVFGLTLDNAETLEQAWVDARWYAGDLESGDYQAASPATKLTLLPAGPSGEYPGAVVFATNVDIQQGGTNYLQGQNGFLTWRMRAKAQDGTVGEWPQGDAPPVFITACGNDEIAPVATNTPSGPDVILPAVTATPTIGTIIVQPIATATQMGIAPQPTATTGIVLIPGVLTKASGQGIVVHHDQGFDLDSGQVVGKNDPNADFVLAEGADPYLDDFDPENGSYVGWAGFVDGSPSKATCNILKSVSPMVVGWPDKQDSYYCFDTSDGNVAWLRLNTYVSQPFSERRLIFDFTTYQ